MCDAMRERVCLAGSGSRDDEQRTGAEFPALAVAELRSFTLLLIQAFDVVVSQHDGNYTARRI